MTLPQLEGVEVHQHLHPHGHDHDHEHAPHDHEHGFRHTADGGPVVLDVGDDIGALVLLADEEMVGAEIHISPYGEPDGGRHVAVHPRQLGGHLVHAAVYPDLATGRYQLWSPDGRPAMTVEIEGGAITQALWAAPGGDDTAA